MGSITRSFANNILAAGKFDGTKLTGDIPTANLSANAPAFDDNKVVNDLATLGLRVHTQENLTNSNTNSQYVDVFQDATGFTNGASTIRNDDEYVSSAGEGVLTGSYTNMSSANFSSQGNWSWSSGGSGNSLTMAASPDNDTGSHTGQGSSPITFGANRPFRWRGGGTYNATGYGPYVGFRKTSTSTSVLAVGNDLDEEGEFYFKGGTNAGNPGIWANDGAGAGNDTNKYANANNNGQFYGVERTAAGIFKIYWGTATIDFSDSSLL